MTKYVCVFHIYVSIIFPSRVATSLVPLGLKVPYHSSISIYTQPSRKEKNIFVFGYSSFGGAELRFCIFLVRKNPIYRTILLLKANKVSGSFFSDMQTKVLWESKLTEIWSDKICLDIWFWKQWMCKWVWDENLK